MKPKPLPASQVGPAIWHDQPRMFPSMAVGLSMGGFYVTAAGSLIATLSRDLDTKPESFAWLGAAYGFGMLLSGLMAPWVMRNGPVWTLRFSPILVFLGTALVAWSPSIVVALIGTTLACLGGTTVSAAVAGTFIGSQGAKYLALSVGISSGVSMMTTVLFSLVERLFPGFGRMALWFVMVLAIPTFIMAWRLPAVPLRKVFVSGQSDPVETIEETKPSRTTPGEPEEPVEPGKNPVSRAGKLMLLSQIFRLILLAGVEFAMYAWAVTRLQDIGVELAAASGLATTFALGMTGGRLLGSAYVKRWGAWWVFVGLGFLGTALVAFVPVVGVVVAGLLISGVGVSCLYPIAATEFSGMPGMRPHYASAIISTLSGLGALLTPLLLGALLSAVGLQVGFVVLLGFYALLVVLPRPARQNG